MTFPLRTDTHLGDETVSAVARSLQWLASALMQGEVELVAVSHRRVLERDGLNNQIDTGITSISIEFRNAQDLVKEKLDNLRDIKTRVKFDDL